MTASMNKYTLTYILFIIFNVIKKNNLFLVMVKLNGKKLFVG